MKHIKHLFWRRGRFAVVSDELVGYMRRWMLWTPWGTLRLHHILSSDDNRDLHDHPWDFASLIVGRDWRDLLSALLSLTVTAGYTEHLPRGGRRWCPAGTVVRHLAADLHRLVLHEPVYTLVVTGPVLRDWGFWSADGGWRSHRHA